ncbi:MAG: TlpA family protein disulfide reductase [Pirellulales bacterium]
MNATDSPDSPTNPSGSSNLLFWIVLAVAAAGVLAYVVVGTAPVRRTVATQNPAIGRTLPYLRLQALSGDAIDVSADDLRGHVTLLNFWGTWCGPCIQEFPELMALVQSLAGRDEFRFYPVSCGSEGEDAELAELQRATAAFLQARKLELPVYADQFASSRRALGNFLGLPQFGYPTTVLLDQDGRLRGIWIGYDARYVGEMRTSIDELLAGSKAPPAG